MGYKIKGWGGPKTTLTVEYDEASLMEVRRLALWPMVYTAFCEVAMEQTVETIMGNADIAMPTPSWSTSGLSTGALESSLTGEVMSPWNAQVFTQTPYAQRVEYSFTGLTDSLGRFYQAWPAEPYADYYGYFSLAVSQGLTQIQSYWYNAGIDAAAAMGFTLV